MSSGPRLLITGAAGQVGAHLVDTAGGGGAVTALDRAALDVTSYDEVRRAVAAHRPDVVINAAAFTAVDRAETAEAAAFAVNRDGAETVALACAEAGAALVHLSTDYVFDGRKGEPYVETDPVSPLNVYGASKAAGESAVREALERHVIVRTAWVFSERPPNFVRTILRLAAEREVLEVVDDQRGHPTWAGDVARACLTIARRLADGDDVAGTVHYAGAPSTTWHGLAEAVVEAARERGGVRVRRVEPVPTSAMPRPAPRPPCVELDGSRAESIFGLSMPDWKRRVGLVVGGASG